MNAEWFIKEQLRQLEQGGCPLFELLSIEKTISPPGKLRYSSPCFNIYLTDTQVFVDATVFFSEGKSVLRATCDYDRDPMSEVFWGSYGILSIFLKAMFLHGIETDINYDAERDTIREDVVAVLRHFTPWVVDRNQRDYRYTFCTNLVAGWCSANLADRPMVLSYIVNESDGRIAFCEPGSVPAGQKAGWITLNAAAYQSHDRPVIDERDHDYPSSIFANVDLELLYRVGYGSKVHGWAVAKPLEAFPILTMLVK